MPPPAPRLYYRAAPHGDSVLSVAFGPLLLASGGEDCALLLHDLRCCASSSSAPTSTSSASSCSKSVAAACSLFGDPVAALAWQGEHVLYVGSGMRVHRVDTRKICSNNSSGSSSSGGGGASSASASVVVGMCDDDISSLSVSRDGRSLAVADDSGAVTLLDLSRAEMIGGDSSSSSLASSAAALSVANDDSGGRTRRGGGSAATTAAAAGSAAVSPSSPVAHADKGHRSSHTNRQPQCLLPSCRLPRAHAASLATAVAFRPGRAGESLASAGCDCTLARWDCCSGRLVRRWRAGEITARRTEGGQGEEGEEEEGTIGAAAAAAGAAAASPSPPAPPLSSLSRPAAGTSRVFNPPFFHALAVPSTSSGKPWSGCVAAALGDGSVAVLDCDAGHQSARRQKDKKKKPSSSSSNSSAAAAASLLSSSSLPPFEGVLAVLRPEDGGHSAAATCVAFVGDGGGEGRGPTTTAATAAPLVASGGDDGRLLFWRWARQAACDEGEEVGEQMLQRRRQPQLPAAWGTALAPFRRSGGGGGSAGSSGRDFIAAATARGRWKLQALASPSSFSSSSSSSSLGVADRGLVAAADTSRVVKVWRVE